MKAIENSNSFRFKLNFVNSPFKTLYCRRERRLFSREPLSTLSCDHLDIRGGLRYIPPNTPDTFPSSELNPENRPTLQYVPGYLHTLTQDRVDPGETNIPD